MLVFKMQPLKIIILLFNRASISTNIGTGKLSSVLNEIRPNVGSTLESSKLTVS